MIKKIVIFAAGAAIGVGGSFLYFKKKYKSEADNEVNEVRQYYQKKIEKEKERLDKLENESNKIDKAIEEYTEKAKDISKKTKVKYNKISEDEKTQIGKENEEVKAEAESPEEDEPTKPYLITEEEFLNDKNDYDKISLTYYMFDDTLADESDEMIDIEENISSDIYNQIAGSDEDLYVRNNVLQTDFEIMRVEGSFHDRYGGF